MHKRRFNRICLLTLFLLPQFSFSQTVNTISRSNLYFDEPVSLQAAGVKNITFLFKDSRRFMWIGTENGLFRFDGRHVIYLHHIPADSFSIPHDHIFSIAEDQKGQIWIGTNNGVATLDPWELKARSYNQVNKSLNGDLDNHILIDGSTVYCYNSKGIHELDSAANQFIDVWSIKTNEITHSGFVYTLFSLNKDELLAGTFKDLVRIQKKNFSSLHIPVMLKQPERPVLVTHIERDPSGTVWVSTWGDGLYQFDTLQNKLLPQKFAHSTVVHWFQFTIEKSRQYIWVSSDDHLYKCAITQNHLIDWTHSDIYQYNGQTVNGIGSGAFYGLLINGDKLWLGGKNVQCATLSGNGFEIVDKALGQAQDIQPISIGSKFYFAVSYFTDSSGLVLYDQALKRVKAFNGFTFDHSHEAHNVGNICIDRFNRIWIATFDGVYIVDTLFHLLHCLNGSQRSDSLTRRKANSIIIRNDTVWIACYNKGIDLFDLDFHKLNHFEMGQGNGLTERLIWKFYCDTKNRMWVCGNENIYLYQPESNNFKKFFLTTEQRGCSPRDICERPNGNLLVASENGLIDFDFIRNRFHIIKSPALEREQDINSVCVDAKGNVWYLTREHVVRYNFNTDVFSVFGKEEGLFSDEGNFVIRSYKNMMLLAQQDALFSFNSDVEAANEERPQLIITKIDINDGIKVFHHPLSSLDLSYKENKIQVELADLMYNQQQQSVFAYRLQGIDTRWQYTSQDQISYASIPPGNFTLYLKSRNYSGKWSDLLTIPITIHPPFWKTIWFIGLVALLLISILILIVRYISQRNLKVRIMQLEKEQAVSRERNRIAQGIHDDIGSTVSSISIMSDLVLKTINADKQSAMISNIRETSISLMEKIDDLVWSIHPGNDSLFNLLVRIREIAIVLFEAKGIDYEIELPETVKSFFIAIEHRQHIYLILKEAINNIVKHSKATKASIKIDLVNENLSVLISDNGKGFNKDQVSGRNGIRNMHSRAAAINGMIKIESDAGCGTSILLTVKIK